MPDYAMGLNPGYWPVTRREDMIKPERDTQYPVG